jgi:4-hydroxy-tetrahydrodipicolinate synthase
VFPAEVVSIYELWKQGEFVKAEEAQRVLRKIRSSFGLGTLPSVLKEVMNLIGLPAGPSRLPVGSLTTQARKQLEEMIRGYREQGLLSS